MLVMEAVYDRDIRFKPPARRLVGKGKNSLYRPGEGTKDWFKIEEAGAVALGRFQRSRQPV
jgi:hypothetical protein